MSDPKFIEKAILPMAKDLQVKAKTTLLQEGKVSTQAYFIEKGIVRLWFNQNGKDITFQFFFRGEFVSSIESFFKGSPSAFSIETLEACELKVIDKAVFTSQLMESSIAKDFFIDLLSSRLFEYQRLFLSRIKDSPQLRYQELLKDQPEIVQRIPQHYIASYLGITSVSLSRIKNKR
ncbi:MAG: Crp/Fnr family transcriptional regulator [Bacteroidota bacterium]